MECYSVMLTADLIKVFKQIFFHTTTFQHIYELYRKSEGLTYAGITAEVI